MPCISIPSVSMSQCRRNVGCRMSPLEHDSATIDQTTHAQRRESSCGVSRAPALGYNTHSAAGEQPRRRRTRAQSCLLDVWSGWSVVQCWMWDTEKGVTTSVDGSKSSSHSTASAKERLLVRVRTAQHSLKGKSTTAPLAQVVLPKQRVEGRPSLSARRASPARRSSPQLPRTRG